MALGCQQWGQNNRCLQNGSVLSVGLRWGVMRRCNHYGSGVLLHPGIQSSPQGCPEGLQGLETPWTALPSASGQRAGRARGWRVLVATKPDTNSSRNSISTGFDRIILSGDIGLLVFSASWTHQLIIHCPKLTGQSCRLRNGGVIHLPFASAGGKQSARA